MCFFSAWTLLNVGSASSCEWPPISNAASAYDAYSLKQPPQVREAFSAFWWFRLTEALNIIIYYCDIMCLDKENAEYPMSVNNN